VELSTGLIFAWLWLSLGPGGELLLYTAYVAVLEVILVIDVEHRLILNRLIWPAIALALLSIPLRAWMAANEASRHWVAAPPIGGLNDILSPWAAGMLSFLLGGVIGLVVFAAMWLIAPQGMGAGDVKLALFVGLITGFPGVLWAIVGSFLLAGLAAALLLLFRRVGLKSEMPFAPFMVLAAIVVLLYGERLLRWYLGG